jgi:hypothetical protein
MAAALLALLPYGAHAQFRIMEVEFEAGVGYTGVNEQAWVTSNGSLLGSHRTASGGDVRVFLVPLGPIRIGAEAGYHFFWSYQAIFGTRLVVGHVDADHVSLVARVEPVSRLVLEVGGGIQFFDEFRDPGFQAAVHYYIPINPHLSMPIGVRGDLVLDSATKMFAVVATAGFSLRP